MRESVKPPTPSSEGSRKLFDFVLGLLTRAFEENRHAFDLPEKAGEEGHTADESRPSAEESS
jgi:hypothetical protein